jgi:hypothetical protein
MCIFGTFIDSDWKIKTRLDSFQELDDLDTPDANVILKALQKRQLLGKFGNSSAHGIFVEEKVAHPSCHGLRNVQFSWFNITS